MSVAQCEDGRFLCFIDIEPSDDFVGIKGPQVWEITDEETARYFAHRFAIPAPEEFVQYCDEFEYLGKPDEVFPEDYYWETGQPNVVKYGPAPSRDEKTNAPDVETLLKAYTSALRLGDFDSAHMLFCEHRYLADATTDSEFDLLRLGFAAGIRAVLAYHRDDLYPFDRQAYEAGKTPPPGHIYHALNFIRTLMPALPDGWSDEPE